MAGHSKWANIQFRKGAQDRKRAKLFTRLIREITVAARDGAETDNNPRLRLALERGQAANLPKAAATKAIARGSGAGGAEACVDVVYEGYASGGVAVLVESATDNRNRTIAEVRHAFTKHGGAMADAGSVNYLFITRGEIFFNGTDHSDEIFELATENGADDVLFEPTGVRVIAAPAQLNTLTRAFDARSINPASVDTVRVPEIRVPVDEDNHDKLNTLIEALEDLDDTDSVYTNADINEAKPD
ncbi:MAG: YebC/PmpR family DNA-binding transcriptional regulator [Proteobacteria bacterium]|nr:YebC/PmpR family DNA-binding transcriptional regulator [Pseudomonadota bacterium]